MKKIIALLLSLVLVFSISGCGKNNETAEEGDTVETVGDVESIEETNNQ